MKQSFSFLFLLLTVVFSSSLLISNLVAFKVVQIGMVVVPAGIFLFPLTYIINDCITEVWGYKKARLMIWLAFAMNFFAVFFYQFAIALPAAPFWPHQHAFATVLSQTPRMAVASLSAFLVGSFLNAYVMSNMKRSMNGAHFSLRAILSTAIGESADSTIFILIAFYSFLSVRQMVWMIVTQALLKVLYEIVVLPITQRVVVFIKQREDVDVIDHDISYRFWKISEI
ncbi:MAG: queuosine precursor transporter [Microbacter sp.]